MPQYKVKPEKDYPSVAGSNAAKGEKRYPTLYIPVSPEILAALELDQAVEVTLKGKVVGLSSNQNANSDRNELQVELHEVSAYPDEDPAGDEEAEDPKEKKTMKDTIDKGLGYTKE